MTKIMICPSVEGLVNQSLCFKCGYPDCTWEFSRNSSMARHLQTHLTVTESTPPEMLFFCPEEGCSHAMDKNLLGFKSLKYLRQHYAKVHGPKDFLCSHCGKGFGAKTYLNLHERMCGVSFVCFCTSSFSSLEALQTHARRRQHSFDLEKYRVMIGSKKVGQITKPKASTSICLPTSTSASEFITTSPACLSSSNPSLDCTSSPSISSTPSIKNRKLVPPPKTPHVNVPILPKPGPHARIVIYEVTSCVYVDCGTQTIPLLVRKRSATQHSQTESKITKTRGTLTTPPSATLGNEGSKQPKRKTSAQTQTKRIKISTETQTPVVTKRKRSIRKKHITTATTQTNTAKTRIGQPTAPAASEAMISSSTAFSSPPTMFRMFESFDEVHSETQTDPNPFFGYRGSEQVASPDSFFSVDNELGERHSLETASRLKTSETQTSPTRKLTRLNGTTKQSMIHAGPAALFFDSSQNESTFSVEDDDVHSPHLSEDLNNFGSYLETMDSETQTYYFEDINEFLY